MGAFEDREQAAEAVFARDLQVRFEKRMAGVRRLANWAAERRGLLGEAATRHAERIIDMALQTPDDAALIQWVLADLQSAGLQTNAADAAAVMNLQR